MLTEDQKAVLEYMDDMGLGAVPIDGKWRFAADFRSDPELAARYAKIIRAR